MLEVRLAGGEAAALKVFEGASARLARVENELEAQRRAARRGLAPRVLRVDCALDPLVQERYGACQLGGQPANVLVFPTLQAANIGFNLVRSMAEVTTVGPIYLGLSKPVHVLQPHSSGVQDVVRLTAIAAMQSTRNETMLTIGGGA